MIFFNSFVFRLHNHRLDHGARNVLSRVQRPCWQRGMEVLATTCDTEDAHPAPRCHHRPEGTHRTSRVPSDVSPFAYQASWHLGNGGTPASTTPHQASQAPPPSSAPNRSPTRRH